MGNAITSVVGVKQPSLGLKAKPTHLINMPQITLTDLAIPPRPHLIDALMKERNKEEPDFRKIEQLISSDIGIAGALLKIANSPSFGLQRKITSISSAMQTMGMRQVISIASGLVLRHLMKGGDPTSMERFWDTTDNVAALCTKLSRRFRFNNIDDAQTFGLFHDCGIPVLMQRFPNYKDVLRAANSQQNRSFIEVEDELLGTNHTVVGNLLTRNWGLSEQICLAIHNHHDLDFFVEARGADNGITKTLIAIGHFAEHLHHLSKRGSNDLEWAKFGPYVLNHFGLSQEDYNDLVYEAEELS